MNTNDRMMHKPSDEEILAGVRRHLADVEPQVPLPPAWGARVGVKAASGDVVRTSVRSRIGFAGLAPLVLGMVVVVVVVGAGLASRPWGGSVPTPTGGALKITYRLIASGGQQITDADLDTTVQIMQSRLDSVVVGGLVAKVPPDEVTVQFSAADDPAAVEKSVGQTGLLQFALLPSETYGTASAPGSTSLPKSGSKLDSALLATAAFSSGDIDQSTATATADAQTQGVWLVSFTLKSDKVDSFATWTGQHINDYFAIVLDGTVLSVPFVQSAITNGQVEIAANFTADSAKGLAVLVRSGALPWPVEQVEVSGPPGVGVPAATSGLIVSPTVTTPTDIPSSGRTLGNADAPVTVDVWVDYRCIACQVFAEQVLPQLIQQYVRTGKAKIVVHDFIVIDKVAGGTDSTHAAEASICAADQGKFWQYQDWLWANQAADESSGAFSDDRLLGMAYNVGLDTQVFSACLSGGTHLAEVQAETATATAMGLVGVPSIVVNGRILSGGDVASVGAAITSALPSASPSPSASLPPSVPPSVIPSSPTAGN
jgi:protein-disulfide isomerase